MNYLINYYKNLSEQLQERVNHLTKLLEATSRTPRSRLSEAQLHTPEKIREKEGKGSRRASKREETISAMLGMLQTPRAYPGIDIDTVHRVLRDSMGLEGGDASPDDLKHVMSHIRKDYYSGSSDPEHKKLDAARQKTLNRYG